MLLGMDCYFIVHMELDGVDMTATEHWETS